MPIEIRNVTPDRLPRDEHEYVLSINGNEMVRFSHTRIDGLAECLRAAAREVDRKSAMTVVMVQS